jgi:hypothetical protein
MKYPKRFKVGGKPDVRESVLKYLQVSEPVNMTKLETEFLQETQLLSYDDVFWPEYRSAVLSLIEEGRVNIDSQNNITLAQ